MTNKEQVVNIVKDLMEQLYEAKGFNDLKCNPLERNLFEAEMQKIWDEFDSHTMLYTDEREEYEDEIEDLEEQVGELASRNEDLSDENFRLRQILTNISEAVNVTWN